MFPENRNIATFIPNKGESTERTRNVKKYLKDKYEKIVFVAFIGGVCAGGNGAGAKSNSFRQGVLFNR